MLLVSPACTTVKRPYNLLLFKMSGNNCDNINKQGNQIEKNDDGGIGQFDAGSFWLWRHEHCY